jgi:acyl-CoA synthetase (AMP-forming)/AMP-acid ligase II
VFRRIVTGWGLTEAGFVTSTTPTDGPRIVATTVGKVVSFLELKVVDAKDVPLPTGVPGRLLVRGATVMKGYLGDPVRTAQTVDADGWLDTGDLGSLDTAGYLRIAGRAKDVVIVGGLNVYPAEIEEAIRQHPGVHDVAVVAMPDARLGEVVAAFVIPESDSLLEEAAFIAWCRSEMANHKVPRAVVQVEALPLNSSPKVDKLQLRERATVLSGPQPKPVG